MKFRTHFFTVIGASIFLLIATVGVNSFVLTGNLMAQDQELTHKKRDLPKEFYNDDEYDEQEETQPEYEEQESTRPDNEEQEETQPEDEEREENQSENEDLNADIGTASDKANKAAQTEKVEVELSAELIKNVQAALNKKINTGLKEDGILGKKTAVAIKKFQKTNGLKETGVLNKITLIKLDITK